MADSVLSHIPLGKTTEYCSRYNPELLCPVPRQLKRDELGLTGEMPFQGEDIWNGYELSWLNMKGKPCVALLECRVPCTTPNIIESKSFKLYLNSFNQTRFNSVDDVESILAEDLSACAGGNVQVEIHSLDSEDFVIHHLAGECIDDLDIEINEYALSPELLKADEAAELTTEVLVSHLLKSNCLVTSQPDWASVQIEYFGHPIDREALLRYLISFREHNEFHEQCVERIFTDLMKYCQPKELTVYARYTRRGGLDINPYRSTSSESQPNLRLSRQ